MRKRKVIPLLIVASAVILIIYAFMSGRDSPRSTDPYRPIPTRIIEPAASGTTIQSDQSDQSSNDGSITVTGGRAEPSNRYAGSSADGCSYVYLPEADFSYWECDK